MAGTIARLGPQPLQKPAPRRSLSRLAVSVALVCSGALGGCSDSLSDLNMPSLPSMPKLSSLNPFAEKQQPLPGKRVPIGLEQDNVTGSLAAADRPIALPPPHVNDAWTQPGGASNNSPGHLALNAAVRTVWSADAGKGSTGYGKLTASPIVYDGKVFTLDAAGKVSAFNASGGGAVWRASTTPANEKDYEGFGGGLAADNGRIYAATGFGQVVALDPRSGKVLWDKAVGAPVRSSPTAAGDRVYVVTKDSQVVCLSGVDGSELWTARGLPSSASILSNPSPAIDGDVVVVPYSTGDVVALKASDGQTLWTESLSRTRTGSSLAALNDTARPVIDSGTVYAVGHSGRMIAAQEKTGERVWSLPIPGLQAPVVVGDNVFVVDTGGQLMAITRRDGKVQWTAKLPGSTTWSGPVLAGNKLWLTSAKGQLVGVAASTGKVESTQDLGQPIYIAPIVAGGRMYVLTDKARLIALN
ncbi:MAG: PQQ-binding-like beta-propeller repeat protein [Hyphomicrobiaceae bacterium]